MMGCFSQKQQHEERLLRMQEATRQMYQDNDASVLNRGVDMILIYLNNLIKYYRGDPRFRKIVKGNTNYRDRVALINGHEVRTSTHCN